MPDRRALAVSLAAVLVGSGAAYAFLTGEIRDRTLRDEDVAKARLERVTLVDTAVADALVEDASIAGGLLERVTIRRATVVDARIVDAHVESATLERTRVERASLDAVTVLDSELRSVHLTRALVVGGSITDGSLDRATLDRVDLLRVGLCRVLVRDESRFVNTACAEPPGPGPAPGPWPREGSFVRYEVEETRFLPDGENVTKVTVTFAFASGAWTARCVGGWRMEAGGVVSEGVIDVAVATPEPPLAPPAGPFDPPPSLRGSGGGGQFVTATVLSDCAIARLPWEVVAVIVAEPTLEGAVARVVAYEAVNPGAGPVIPQNASAAWDAATGLMVHFRTQEGLFHQGALVGTDAPLSRT